MYGSLKVEFCS